MNFIKYKVDDFIANDFVLKTRFAKTTIMLCGIVFVLEKCILNWKKPKLLCLACITNVIYIERVASPPPPPVGLSQRGLTRHIRVAAEAAEHPEENDRVLGALNNRIFQKVCTPKDKKNRSFSLIFFPSF